MLSEILDVKLKKAKKRGKKRIHKGRPASLKTLRNFGHTITTNYASF
jgi:hypothetical protein